MEHQTGRSPSSGGWKYETCENCFAAKSTRESDGFSKGWKIRAEIKYGPNQWLPAPECPENLIMAELDCDRCKARLALPCVPEDEARDTGRFIPRGDQYGPQVAAVLKVRELVALGVGLGWRRRYGVTTWLPDDNCLGGYPHLVSNVKLATLYQ
jgi:hypothetical protein